MPFLARVKKNFSLTSMKRWGPHVLWLRTCFTYQRSCVKDPARSSVDFSAYQPHSISLELVTVFWYREYITPIWFTVSIKLQVSLLGIHIFFVLQCEYQNQLFLFLKLNNRQFSMKYEIHTLKCIHLLVLLLFHMGQWMKILLFLLYAHVFLFYFLPAPFSLFMSSSTCPIILLVVVLQVSFF